jgi:hydroxymethylbilane synthase
MKTILTRTSPLAMWQAQHAAEQLQQHVSSPSFKLQGIQTTGDQNKDLALHDLGGKALFIKTIEEALLNRQGDLAVHSMKDMSAQDTPGLFTTCIGKRADPRDALVTSLAIQSWRDIPHGACIGTSSLRRSAFLARLRPDLKFKAIRGNIGTRINKCEQGQYHAIVLAAAGLHRLQYHDHIKDYFAVDDILPAACQGILAIQCRADDHTCIEWLKAIADPQLKAQSQAERSLCHALDGNCQTPIGAHATILGNNQLCLQAWVASLDGTTCLQAQTKGDLSQAITLGAQAGEQLKTKGVAALLR